MRKFLQSRFVSEYGNFFVLLLLCAYYSFATLEPYDPVTPRAGQTLARFIVEQHPQAAVVIITPDGDQNLVYAAAVEEVLARGKVHVLAKIAGRPSDAARELQALGRANTHVDFVITQYAAAKWPILSEAGRERLAAEHPSLRDVKVVKPASYTWPTFLTHGNLRSIMNNIAIIAIIVIGMTMVIITAGIDLSVGSLIALSGVVAAVSVQRMVGDAEPSLGVLLLAGLLAVGLCGLVGLFSGAMVTAFDVPSFIVTLAIMQVARGAALEIAQGPSPIEIKSAAFHLLGGGELLGIPNPVIVMVVLYLAAHVLMSHTALGRYIYAVGGNPEAARLSGVPVKRVLLFAYVMCGALAGLAGVMDASLFRVGRAVAGQGYELQIIAAVVVGGTSLAGGEGKIFGTFIGALILSVIQNGMNLTKVESKRQLIVFGALILIAVLLDRLKTRGTKTA